MPPLKVSAHRNSIGRRAAARKGFDDTADIPARILPRLTLATLLAAIFPSIAMAQANPHWEDWRTVSRVSGIATVQEEDGNIQNRGTLIGEEVRSVTYTFTYETDTPGSASSWMGDDVGIAVERHERVIEGGDVRTVDASARGRLAQGAKSTVFSANWSGSGAGTWSFNSGQEMQEPYEETTVNENGTFVSKLKLVRSIWLEGRLDDATANGGPGLLTAEKVVVVDGTPESPNFHDRVVTKLRLWPEYDDVVLEVRIPGYADWRPLGSIGDPKSAGSTLTITAELKSRNPAEKILIKPRSFDFRLLNTSREPGVCMNWPLGATDRDPDMRLRPYPGTHGGLDAEGQELMVNSAAPDATSPNVAKAFLDSFDFGGRSELQVTATLDDGRTIVGTLIDPGGNERMISLPKSNVPGGWIARSWRRDHHVENVADSDDTEDAPKGDGTPGDGYTLYEEYRGFVEHGKHVEGDPQSKDFFILNLIGADASAGIGLFQRLSGLVVHGKLTDKEMSESLRLMNGNHRDAPHRVDQHGVWLKTAMHGEAGNGGLTMDTPNADPKKKLKPGTTKGIVIVGRNDPESNFIHPYNNTSAGQSVAYTKTVAHELFHSVGVAHHGEGNQSHVMVFAPPGTLQNPGTVSFAGYSLDNTSAWRTLLFEDNTAVSSVDYPAFLDQLAQYNARFRSSPGAAAWQRGLSDAVAAQAAPPANANPGAAPPDPVKLQEQMNATTVALRFNKQLQLGIKEGQSSGDQDCVMRYRYANSYKRVTDFNVFYLTAKGSEPVGLQLCRSAIGTGINAPDRNTPQPRFFNATNGRGNCTGQVSPNDAFPPAGY